MVRLVAAFAALAAFANVGCGTPDSQVFGGIAGPTGIPNAFINDVGSAIAGIGNFTDSGGNTVQLDVFILTDRKNLCVTIERRPDYFRNPPEAFVALVMIGPLDRLGTFRVGAANTGATLMVTAGPGNEVTRYPGSGGSFSVRDLNIKPGGDGTGTFDLGFVDLGGLAHEVFGKFKTRSCAAIGNVVF